MWLKDKYIILHALLKLKKTKKNILQMVHLTSVHERDARASDGSILLTC